MSSNRRANLVVGWIVFAAIVSLAATGWWLLTVRSARGVTIDNARRLHGAMRLEHVQNLMGKPPSQQSEVYAGGKCVERTYYWQSEHELEVHFVNGYATHWYWSIGDHRGIAVTAEGAEVEMTWPIRVLRWWRGE